MTTTDMPNRTRIALFDLDHTLLPIDSDFTWTTFTNAKGWTDPEATQRQNDAFYADYKAGQLDMDAYTRFVTRAVQGLPPPPTGLLPSLWGACWALPTTISWRPS